MNKKEILSEYKNQEDKMMLAKVLDKIDFANTRGKLENTDFLNMHQLALIESFLKKIKCTNYVLWGGYETAERRVVIIYPEKYDNKMIEKNYSKIASIIRIKLPEQEKGKLTHQNFLGGVMKLGIERDKVGDILVNKDGADIIVLNDIVKFLMQELSSLTRFKESIITQEQIQDLKEVKSKTEEVKIIVPSLRLDNFVSDLARTSRNKAVEIIKAERVFVNGQNEQKTSKQIKQGDIITIRGKGRFKIKEFTGKTRNGRTVVLVEKFV